MQPGALARAASTLVQVSDRQSRGAADRCPGVFAPHPAADGALARIRLVGGVVSAEQMQILAAVSAEHGDGFLELTGRGNLQIRGITDVDTVADLLTAADLVPSTTHEKIRNIEVSALTGRLGGLVDLRPVADALDAALRATAGLDDLSGRFLFGLDDGHGDIVSRRPDVAVVVTDDGGIRAQVVLDGTHVGAVADLAEVPAEMIAVALDMAELASGTSAWRITDLDAQARDELLKRARARLSGGVLAGGRPVVLPMAAEEPVVGWFAQDDGRVLLGAVVELGRLPARLAEFLAAIGAPILITPNREILIADLSEGVAETVVRVLAPMGLIFDAASPWAVLSCCAGAPGCAKSHAPVRDDLLARVEQGPEVTEREHWVGCDRGCGSPPHAHRRVQATGDGYRQWSEAAR